ncbi:agmatine deiminase family protein [Phormidium sp. CCY1219]|uniref:agmatine deiminase family protein n=1 Tax=Phormidium sp. CCY1219 TaxID=2886104 RepID=UPI002D1F75FC|nr:agmatine deiminase family protein [Phormidium sp. CCY1219]MEB3829387.1 agmatine deiminase family protein [Phormidium sp. CCY1219]
MTILSAPATHDRMPAEWEPHAACWLAFPSHEKEWGEYLSAARAEFVQLCRAIADPDPRTGKPRGERLEILVLDEAGKTTAEAWLDGIPARFHLMPFGDIWLRDIGPIFRWKSAGKLATIRFNFNGWGGKYIMPGDEKVAQGISDRLGLCSDYFPEVIEGGGIEIDGEGTCLTTRQCLLNSNRNPDRSPAQLEAVLRSAFGIKKVLWIERGLLNDHTDGHIDTIARFVAPGVVLCMEPRNADDPNAEILAEIARDLSTFTDAKGRHLRVIRIPSPGKIVDDRGEIMPASYVNFYIGNRTVVVPTYGSEWDESAVEAIAKLFPTRRAIGLSAKAILTGGGAFHCITQQHPAFPAEI